MKRSQILPLISIGTFFNDSHAFSKPSLSLRGIKSLKAKEDMLTRRRTSSRSENNSHDGGLSTVEAKRVQRFTTGYDKLCKTCPTLLQPRVDTLTEMIVGLTKDERKELMANVARRLEEIGNEATAAQAGIQTSQDTYNFQTARATTCTDSEVNAKDVVVAVQPNDASNEKLIRKLDKAKAKFEYNRRKAAKARRLLACCNALLARDLLANEPTIYNLPNPLDNDIYHHIDELKTMSRQDLKLERLKLHSQKAKFESKVAKGRLKLYDASRALVMTTT